MSRAGATFQEMLESWFLAWLMGHRGLSPQTVSSYRDAFKLLKGENKEQVIIPGAVHTDLYDNTDVIPFDKMEDFFCKNLK